MKSEPDVFSVNDLEKRHTSLWDGVRNYQARNFMMEEMAVGDQVLFYHSNATPPGVAGLAKVVASAEPDPTQFDMKSEYYDPKATLEKPTWFAVRIGFVEKFRDLLPLDKIRKEKALAKMPLLKRGQRLSIQPVSEKEFAWICKVAKR